MKKSVLLLPIMLGCLSGCTQIETVKIIEDPTELNEAGEPVSQEVPTKVIDLPAAQPIKEVAPDIIDTLTNEQNWHTSVNKIQEDGYNFSGILAARESEEEDSKSTIGVYTQEGETDPATVYKNLVDYMTKQTLSNVKMNMFGRYPGTYEVTELISKGGTTTAILVTDTETNENVDELVIYHDEKQVFLIEYGENAPEDFRNTVNENIHNYGEIF